MVVVHINNFVDFSGAVTQQFTQIREILEQRKLDIKVVNQPVLGIESAFKILADTIDTTFMPVVKAMNHKIDLDLNILHKVGELSSQLRAFTNGKPNVESSSYKVANGPKNGNNKEEPPKPS